MEALSPAIEEIPATRIPLRIVVSEAGQTAALKALVAQSVPMLRNPGNFTTERRLELAKRLARVIRPRRGNDEPELPGHDSELDSDDDPGTWLEDKSDHRAL